MGLSILGLVTVDTIEFNQNTSYLGGGALGTAWISSLWGTSTQLFSISCESRYRKIITNNISWNSPFFSNEVLSPQKRTPQIFIREGNRDYEYTIFSLDKVEEEVIKFLTMPLDNKYIKLPASNFDNLGKLLINVSFNPQGEYDLVDLTHKIHTHGFLFLNKNELLGHSKLDFLSALQLFENRSQSVVVTLGKDGVVCYSSITNYWYFCPSISLSICANTLGCGDAFAGGFLSAFCEEKDIEDCLVQGTLSASLVTFSPSNMITMWFDKGAIRSIGSYMDELRKYVCCFTTTDMLMRYLSSKKCCPITLSFVDSLEKQFVWEIN